MIKCNQLEAVLSVCPFEYVVTTTVLSGTVVVFLYVKENNIYTTSNNEVIC